jgi:hypothetical protein
LLDGDHERRIARWRLRLLNVEHAVFDILAELRQSGREDVRVGDTRPVHEAITYMENHRDKMNYAALRAAGLPIGSGNTEATCKNARRGPREARRVALEHRYRPSHYPAPRARDE